VGMRLHLYLQGHVRASLAQSSACIHNLAAPHFSIGVKTNRIFN
jgi:hypothetical protein